MPEGLLPLFPLELVLLPHTVLPLHIFEDRYKEMIGECLAEGTEFGVVQARGNGILRTGCTAAIAEVAQRYEDGRMDIVTVGRRRFEIEEIDTDRSFLRASVEFFDDEPAPTPSLELRRKVLDALLELQRATGSEEEPPELDDPDLSFRIARVSEDLDFRQMLLSLRSESERLLQVAKHLRTLLVRKKTEAEMQRVVRQNGHGRHAGHS